MNTSRPGKSSRLTSISVHRCCNTEGSRGALSAHRPRSSDIRTRRIATWCFERRAEQLGLRGVVVAPTRSESVLLLRLLVFGSLPVASLRSSSARLASKESTTRMLRATRRRQARWPLGWPGRRSTPAIGRTRRRSPTWPLHRSVVFKIDGESYRMRSASGPHRRAPEGGRQVKELSRSKQLGGPSTGELR